jgi:hypothetical protein
VGGGINPDERVVVLYRGNFDRLAVPYSWFERKSPIEPDFDRFRLSDYGQTICFGSFEGASDAVLYDFDRDYRARAKKRQLDLDDSFGASLRRLREVKDISRSDFRGVSAKEIARIERNEVAEPRAETLLAIARRLGVRVDDIATY